MLVLSRNWGESVIIDGHIKVVVVSIHGEKVRLGIEAPRDMPVDREEVHVAKLRNGVWKPRKLDRI